MHNTEGSQDHYIAGMVRLKAVPRKHTTIPTEPSGSLEELGSDLENNAKEL